MREASALDQLCRLLRGEPVPHPAWDRVIGLANRNLVTPRLAGGLDAADAPDDVRLFVQEVARRNAERNERLYAQLGVAAQALNAVGVMPLVIKGGARLVRTGGRCLRVINDLDLVVSPGQVDEVRRALCGAGFSMLSQNAGATMHGVGEFARPHDVGPIDLHQRPPGPAGLVCAPELLTAGAVWRVGPGQVRAPAPDMHIYFQALHDQLHDGAYWRGGFDLGHAWDIADLIQGGEPVDWDRLALLPPTRLMKHAVEAQLMACHRLTGAPIPKAARGWRSRFQARRQSLQHHAPSLTVPLAGLAMLSEAGNLIRHRAQDRLGRARAGLPPRSDSLALRLARLQRVLATQQGA